MSITAASIVAKVSMSGVAEAQAGLLGLGDTAEATSNSLKSIAVGGLLLLGGSLLAVGALSVKSAGDFQASMTRLVTSAGEVASNLPMISAGILKMSVDTATSTAQLAAGAYFVESAGSHGAAALAVLGVAARGAKSENADLDTVARALTTTMTDYHIPVTQAASAMNGLIITVQNGKTTLQDLSASMGAVLPIASSLHIPFAQVAGTLDTMTNAGLSADNASQNLAHVLTALSAPGGVASKAMKAVGLSAQEVKDTLVNQGLPQALQLIEDHVGTHFPAGSAAGVTALKNMMGGLVGVKLAAQLSGDSLKTTQENIDKITKAMQDGSGAVLGWDLVQGNFNFKLDQAKMAMEALGIKLGTLLLPLLSQILDKVTPVITSFTNWVTSTHALSDVVSFFHANIQIILPILAGLGAILLTVVVPAVVALAASVVVALLPFIAIGVAVGGLTAIFMHFYTTNAPFKTFINDIVTAFQQLWAIVSANFLPVMKDLATFFIANVLPVFERLGAFISANFLPVMRSIGAFLVTTFTPVWQQLVSTFNSQLLPAWNSLVKAIQPIMPELKIFGQVIGAVVVVAIGLFIGVLGGLISMLANLLTGVIKIFGGVVMVISGALQIAGGVIAFFVDLFTLKWSKLGADIMVIAGGWVTFFSGLWQIISGIFSTAFGMISGFCSGFISSVVGFFTSLWNQLVGHSIIPDMINGIVSWFAGLPGKVGAIISGMVSWVVGQFISLATSIGATVLSLVASVFSAWTTLSSDATNAFTGLVSTVQGALNGLVSFALSAGASIVQNIASGITGAIGAVGTAISGVANFISSHLPHSPAKIGPLTDLVLQGSLITEQIGQGMVSGLPKLQTSLTMLLKPISTPSTSGSFGGGGGSQYQFSPAGGGAPTINITVQSGDISIDGTKLAYKLMPHIVDNIRLATGVRSM